MKRILCALCCFAATALAQQNTCPSLESGVEAEVLRVRVAKDDLGAFRAVGDKALSALRLCPQSARLWYLAARSAEVLESPSNGQAFAAEGGLNRIVADALSHAPSSAPAATVAARVQVSSSLARKALALDPNYQPARRALAELLAKEGAIDEALRLASAKTPSGPMHLTRAHVLLAAKRPAEAVAEARKIPMNSPPLSRCTATSRKFSVSRCSTSRKPPKRERRCEPPPRQAPSLPSATSLSERSLRA